MSDNILSAVLTFSLLAAGTAAMGSEMLSSRHAPASRVATVTLPTVTVIGHREAAQVATVTLPTVTVVGHRATAPAVVTLQRVTVIGHRQASTALAAETVAAQPQRVE